MHCQDACLNVICHANSYCYRGLSGDAKCICDSDFGKDDDGKCRKLDGRSFSYYFFYQLAQLFKRRLA